VRARHLRRVRRLRPHLPLLFDVAIVATGLGLLVLLTVAHGPSIVGADDPVTWVLAGAVLLAELVPIKIGRGTGEVAPSTTFTFALLLHSGVTAAVVAQALALIVRDGVDQSSAPRCAFRVARQTLALAAAGAVLSLTHITGDLRFDWVGLGAYVAAGSVYFLLSSGVSIAERVLGGRDRLRDELSADLLSDAATEAILIGLAPLAVIALERSPLAIVLLAVPLLAVHSAGRHASIHERLAHHDSLTGLPNRVLFGECIRHAITTHGEEPVAISAVMLIDLDRFKEINDTLGHHEGDEVLRKVASRLRETLRESDTVGRLGGDEFAILLPAVRDAEAAIAIARKLCDAVSVPMDLDGVTLEIGASIGIACHPQHGDDVETLMQRADVAMYQAKERKSGVCCYAADEDDNTLMRLTLAGGLRHAIDADELAIHYQPQVDVATGRPVGAEALLRWRHPEHGLMPPAEFIPIAEQTGLIVPLTMHVLDASLLQVAVWREDGLDLTVSVNLSPRVLAEPDLPDRIAGLCRKRHVSPRALVVEITESMIVADPDRALPVAEQLSRMGVTVSLDDFGTGFSALDLLKRLPVSEVKIDRSFVLGMLGDTRDLAIVRYTTGLARELGMRVVAEGVETSALHDCLVELGCDVGQGYLYGRPMPAPQFTRWAREHVQVRHRTALIAR